MNRKDFMTGAAATSVLMAGCQSVTENRQTKKWQNGASRWPICLDTATLSKDLSLEEKVELAANAGFDAIEPWDRELKNHEDQGKSLSDLKNKITDLGMFVPSVIGMWGALAPEKSVFNKEIEAHKNRMRMVSALGAKHIQVIPKFDRKETLDHDTAAWAYGKVCELAKEYHLEPAVIFLNFVNGLGKMSDAANIARKSGTAKPQIIPDTYHMFLGNSPAHELKSYDKDFIAIFQFADAGPDVNLLVLKV